MSNTTNVVGYYNGNRWPIQLVASKFNVTLTLKPGEYILDRQGRKVNDTYFEVFANNRQLHREVSETAVPVIAIPEATAVVATQSSNPVRAVTQWKRDARGIRQPIMPDQMPPPPPPPTALPAAVVASATDSVQPMTMEEARKRGLVRKVREVPEDYGVNDTTGLPPSGIPKMKYSIDPSINKPAPPLPKEMLALPKDDVIPDDLKAQFKQNRQTRAQLVAGLAQGTKAPAPEEASTNPFANAGVAMTNSPITTGSPEPVFESDEPETNDEPEVVVEPHTIDAALPEPDLTEVEQDAPPATIPLKGSRTDYFPPPPSAAPAPPLRPLTPRNQFTCMACGAPHKFRSQLFKHAQQKHPERINAIMASYPEVPH